MIGNLATTIGVACACDGDARDDGAARETRVLPCLRTTWCVFERDHAGACVEFPRAKHERPAWDLATPDPTGWREVKR